MYNPKVLSIFNNLEKQSSNICHEIDAFMENVLKWADELGGIFEKEYTASKDSTFFLLPKTPSEKKTRNRKARNALVSKCSVINATLSQNETSNLDDRVSLRTRGAKRAATSKISQLTDTTYNLPHESIMETTETEKNTKDVPNATFVLPKASTRTKPVLKITQLEPAVAESQRNENQVLDASGNSEKELSFKSVASSPESLTRRKTSRCHSTGQPQPPSPKVSITVNETPTEPPNKGRISRTFSGSPAKRTTKSNLFRSHSGSPVLRSSKAAVARSSSPATRLSNKSRRSNSNSPAATRLSNRSRRSNSNSPVATRLSNRSRRSSSQSRGPRSGKISSSTSQEPKTSVPEARSLSGNEIVTIKKEATPKGLSTYIVVNETLELINDSEKTPVVAGDEPFRFPRTSTPAIDVEKTPVVNEQDHEDMEMDENVISSTRIISVENNGNESLAVNADNVTEEVSEDAQVPKKKRKLKKDEEVKENVEEIADTVRITRTKSKALKKMMEENETKQADLSAFAKKLINRAKMTSLKKNQLAALIECNSSTPTNGPGHLGSHLPFGNLTTSKSKYHLLLSGSKKLKTPLAVHPNSALKIAKASGDKERTKAKMAGRDSSVENLVRTATKPPKDDLEKETKLRSKKEKEEEAALKRQNVIRAKQEELKRKNEFKHQMAMKQREKLEQEKYLNMVQLEKEKEERHKLILQERQIKLKEEAFKKKMLTQQKIAETVERRRMEEEARLAKLKEMEAEEQRLALEKQKEQERQEKRAQERLAQKKAREEYEQQLKQELEAERIRAEKLLTAKKCLPSASKLQSASKRQKFGLMADKREWDYKPRHENDYGLEDEHSEVDSEDEKSYDKSKPAVPWGKKIMYGKSPVVKVLTLDMLCEFMPCYQKSPDIYKMFRMTPSKRIKRSSSAIWNTPSS